MNYGTYISFEGENLIEKMHKSYLDRTINMPLGNNFLSCFSPYYSYYYHGIKKYKDLAIGKIYMISQEERLTYTTSEGLENFYFFFPYYPNWYEKLINDLNNEFSNIQFKIIGNKDVYLKKEIIKDTWGGKIEDLSLNISKIGEKYSCPIFHIEVDKNYNGLACLSLGYFIHHIVRQFSIAEGFLTNSEIKSGYEGNVLDFLCKVNNRCSNRGADYRALYKYNSLTPQHVKLIDDIKLCNSRLVKAYYTQTEVIRALM